MEPITTSLIVAYLAKKLKDNKTFQDFASDFTSATFNWIRPLFLKDDGEPKEVLEKLKANPESESRQKMVQAILESEMEDNPQAKDYLEEMYQVIKAKESKDAKISAEVINSVQTIVGNVTGNISQNYNEKY